MKKALFIFFLAISLFGNAQKVSGYLGKRCLINLGGNVNFLIYDITSRAGYNPSALSNWNEKYMKGDLGSARAMQFNFEFAAKNYFGLGLNIAYHKNIFPMQDANIPIINANYPTIVAPSLTLLRFNPYMSFYSHKMAPAPVGNFLTFGLSYSIASLDSFDYLLPPGNEFYISNGKRSFYDLTFSLGRSMALGKLAILKVEIGFPYVFGVLRSYAIKAFVPTDVYYRKPLRENQFDQIGTQIKHKLVDNNWSFYGIGIGIPF